MDDVRFLPLGHPELTLLLDEHDIPTIGLPAGREAMRQEIQQAVAAINPADVGARLHETGWGLSVTTQAAQTFELTVDDERGVTVAGAEPGYVATIAAHLARATGPLVLVHEGGGRPVLVTPDSDPEHVATQLAS